MRAGLVAATESLQALAKRVVSVMSGWVDIQETLEDRTSELVLSGVEVGPAERLQDRLLVGLQAVRPFEHDRGLGVMPPVEQRLPTLEEVVGAFRLVGSVVSDVVIHDQMVARTP